MSAAAEVIAILKWSREQSHLTYRGFYGLQGHRGENNVLHCLVIPTYLVFLRKYFLGLQTKPIKSSLENRIRTFKDVYRMHRERRVQVFPKSLPKWIL